MEGERQGTLQSRLQQLQDRYNKLSTQATLTTVEAWPRLPTDNTDLWATLYSPYVQWIQWQYTVPSNDDMLQLVHFNVAVSIHNSLTDSAATTPEPVLTWLPSALCEGRPTNGELPLWSRDRLEAYIKALPQKEVLQRHAIPKGLVGVVRGIPRTPPLVLSDLVQGRGWAPAPEMNNFQSTAAMTGSEPVAPLDMDTLFGTM